MLFRYLLSYILFSDAHSTIGSTAIIFGKTELGMTSNELILIAMIVPLSAAIGNYFYLYYQRAFKKSTLHMNTLLIILISFIPFYGLIGVYSDSIGLHSKTEMYLIGVFYGFHIGAVQSFSRVLYSELIPSGLESEFFSLYEITDKGTSWLGPLMIGIINNSTGSLRNGFYGLFAMLLVSIPILLGVDPIKGKQQAIVFNENETHSGDMK